MFEVIIVGCGITGAAAAHYLTEAGVQRILCLDGGAVGLGSAQKISPLTKGVPRDHIESDGGPYYPHVSGTAVLPGGAEGPAAIKMVLTVTPFRTLADFAEHHSWDGVRTYLDATKRGRDMNLALARKLLSNSQMKQLGSMLVAERDQVDDLRTEFCKYVECGCECSWVDEAEVVQALGSDAGFIAGIWFPDDGVVDSTSLARALIKKAVEAGAVTLREQSAVVGVQSSAQSAVVHLQDGSCVRARHVILATGGLWMDENLSGILKPCYSYLTVLRHAPPLCGANYFTFGFQYDWCVSDGYLRISGEDHFSGLKRPRWEQRCRRLAEWGWKKFPNISRDDTYFARYGVYSETADYLPIVGSVDDENKSLCYMVGCNAVGQSILFQVAAMAPALLGYRDFAPEEAAVASLFSIRRFVGKSAMKARHMLQTERKPHSVFGPNVWASSVVVCTLFFLCVLLMCLQFAL
jgi:glycine/D-amino acid oxidase-like deaminating enzyme